MKSREIIEIKGTLNTKKGCSIKNMVAAYIAGEARDIIMCSYKNLFQMDKDLAHKYISLAAEIFQYRAAEDKVLTLARKEKDDKEGDALKWTLESKLKDDEAVLSLINKLNDTYSYVGNFLILLFYNDYDIPGKGSDGINQDESEIVYSHIIGCICPLKLEKPEICYERDKHDFAFGERRWKIAKPTNGFLYPAFEERRADYDRVMYYTADASNPDHKLMEEGLECEKMLTATECREFFEKAVKERTASAERAESILKKANKQFELMTLEEEVNYGVQPKHISPIGLERVLQHSGMTDEEAQDVADRYMRRLAGCADWAKVAHLQNSKAAAAFEAEEKREKLRELMKQAGEALMEAGLPRMSEEIDKMLQEIK